MFQAMQNIVPSHMADKTLFNFAALSKDTELTGRDTAFDKEAVPTVPVGFEAEDDVHSDSPVQIIALS